MSTTVPDAPVQGALEQASRRESLLALGLAAVAMGGANAGVTEARKRKRCKGKRRERCSTDAAACKEVLAPMCPDPEHPACIAIAKCCDECTAEGFARCYAASLMS
jgi:hypothetical protein